jgi:hypothetical protein
MDFLNGASSAIVDNVTLGVVNQRADKAERAKDQSAFSFGESFGDALGSSYGLLVIAAGGSEAAVATAGGITAPAATIGVAGVTYGGAVLSKALGSLGSKSFKSEGGGSNSNKPQGPKEAQKAVNKNKAPKEIDRIDIPKLDPNGKPLHGQQGHAHIKDKSKVAVNQDGTYKHGEKPLTNKVSDWLRKYGWNL